MAWRRWTAALLCTLLLSSTTAHAGVVVVDVANGPGADTNSITTGIALAADGDVILVREGTYATFVVANRSLAIVADIGGPVVVNGRIRVRDLEPGKQVLLRGLHTGSLGGLLVERCDGPVWVEACTFKGGNGTGELGMGGDGLRADNDEAVTVVRCTALGGTGGNGLFGVGTGGAGIRSGNSRLAVHGDTIIGGMGGSIGEDGGLGGRGFWVTAESFGFASGSVITGGAGGDAEYDDTCPDPGEGGNAVDVVFSSQAVTLDCELVPGAGGQPQDVPFHTSCEDGDPGQDLVVLLPSAHQGLAGRERSVRIPGPVREGVPVQVIFSADEGDFAWVMASPLQEFLPLLEYRGVLPVPVTTPLLPVGPVPASGQLMLSTPLPELPDGIGGAVVYVASVFTGTAEGVVIGSPGTLIAIDTDF